MSDEKEVLTTMLHSIFKPEELAASAAERTVASYVKVFSFAFACVAIWNTADFFTNNAFGINNNMQSFVINALNEIIFFTVLMIVQAFILWGTLYRTHNNVERFPYIIATIIKLAMCSMGTILIGKILLLAMDAYYISHIGEFSTFINHLPAAAQAHINSFHVCESAQKTYPCLQAIQSVDPWIRNTQRIIGFGMALLYCFVFSKMLAHVFGGSQFSSFLILILSLLTLGSISIVFLI